MNPEVFKLRTNYGGKKTILPASYAAGDNAFQKVLDKNISGLQPSDGLYVYLMRKDIERRYKKHLALYAKAYGLPKNDPRIKKLAKNTSGYATYAGLWTPEGSQLGTGVEPGTKSNIFDGHEFRHNRT